MRRRAFPVDSRLPASMARVRSGSEKGPDNANTKDNQRKQHQDFRNLESKEVERSA